MAIAGTSLNVFASDYMCQIKTTTEMHVNKAFISDDIDGDGDRDLVIAKGHTVTWLETTGPGERVAHDVGNAQRPCCVSSTDLDRDGDLDFIFPETDSTIVWYENIDGKGLELSRHELAYPENPISDICIGDMDNDGDMDILTNQGNGLDVVWYENKGLDHAFEQYRIMTLPRGCTFIASDMDDDDNLDILTCMFDKKSDLSKITYHHNTSGSFQSHVVISESSRINSLYSVDMDNDQDKDIVAWLSTSEIVWYENREGSFSKRMITSDLKRVVTIYPEDINQDGWFDIVCKIKAGKTVYLENPRSSGLSFLIMDLNEETLLSDAM